MPVDTVLIIDTDHAQLAGLGARLAQLGYKTVEASDVATALNKLDQLKVDAIVCRAHTPTIDGYEFCRKVRTNERFAAVPVILFESGELEAASEAEAREAGAFKIVAEGADFQGIVEALSMGFQQSRSIPQDADAVLLADICSAFLAEAEEQTRRFIAEFETGPDLEALTVCAHRWSGAGNMLGFGQIGQAAGQLETLLRNPSTKDRGAILDALKNVRNLILTA